MDGGEENSAGVVTASNDAVDEDELARLQGHGVWAWGGDAADGAAAADEGFWEGVGALAVVDFAVVGEDLGSDDADDGTAGGGLWCGDCFELEGRFESLEDESAMVRGEVRSHGEDADGLMLWELVSWLYMWDCLNSKSF